MLATFDYPEMGPNCTERTVSIVSPQSLMLLNNGRVRGLAGNLAARIESRVSGPSPVSSAIKPWGLYVDEVYHVALTREPTAEERRLGIEALQQLVRDWKGDRQAALETYCHTILNSAAFIYVD